MIEVAVQYATKTPGSPSEEKITSWLRESLSGVREHAELAIRIVDVEESAKLNSAYRSKQGPTNVLSFAAELPSDVDSPLLGDIVICAAIVNDQAEEQGKTKDAHWAHMVVHGLLHLLGHDHEQASQAEEMEQLETEILSRLGYPNPY